MTQATQKKHTFFTPLTRSLALFVFLSTSILIGGFASGAQAVTLNCQPFNQCTDANTIWFNTGPTVTTYSPGESIDISASISSDDFPVQAPFNPSLSVRLDSGPSTGDLILQSFIAQDFRTGVYLEIPSGLVAPATLGAHTLHFSIGVGQSHAGWSYQSNPVTARQFDVMITVASAPQVGTINVTSNIGSAAYTITGPATLNGSGTSTTFSNQPLGTYAIAWQPVAGYTTPSSLPQTIASNGGTLNFNGNYVLNATCGSFWEVPDVQKEYTSVGTCSSANLYVGDCCDAYGTGTEFMCTRTNVPSGRVYNDTNYITCGQPTAPTINVHF